MNPNVTLKNVLLELLEMNHISGSKLSSKLSLPRTTITRIIKGETDDPRRSTLEKISDYFNITIDQLLGKQPLTHRKDQTKIRNIPLYKMHEIKNYNDNNKKTKLLKSNILEVIDKNIPKNAFAVELTDNAMSPQFKIGTILIIDPSATPTHRNFVIAKIKQTNCAIFRLFIIKNNESYLEPINASLFKTLKFNTNDKILGVLLETRHRF